VVNLATFQLGADGAGSSLDAVIDELRSVMSSARPRRSSKVFFLRWSSLTCPATVSHEYLTNLVVHPHLTATTSVGVLQIPPAALSWASSDTTVAVVEASGRILAKAAGTATLTATLKTLRPH